jgi:tripartite ATP-independent transporter DctM subunit
MLIVAYIFGNLSIGRLFLTGVVPGILVGFAMMLIVALMAPIRNFPRGQSHWSIREIGLKLLAAAPGLGVPFVVVGGITGGYFTATEAGAIAVAYALIVGGIVQRNLRLSDISGALLGAARTSGMVFLLLGTAKLVAWILVMEQIPQRLSAVIDPYISSQSGFLIAVIVLFFLLGTVMEGMAAMIMLVPVLATMAPKFGVEPHHLAIVIVMTVQLALITPPVALGLFIIQPFAGCTMAEAAKEVVPFLFAILSVILLVVFFPAIAEWLPDRFGLVGG